MLTLALVCLPGVDRAPTAGAHPPEPKLPLRPEYQLDRQQRHLRPVLAREIPPFGLQHGHPLAVATGFKAEQAHVILTS